MSDNAISSIKRVSKFVRLLILFIAIIHIGGFILTMIFAEQSTSFHQAEIIHNDATYSATAGITGTNKELAKLLEGENFNSMAILGIADIVMYSLIYFFLFQLFSLYQQGKIFTKSNINCIKNIGRCLLFWVLISLIYPVLVVLFIRFTGLSETLPLQLAIGSTELIHFLCGAIITVIAWIMSEAQKLHQEQELVI